MARNTLLKLPETKAEKKLELRQRRFAMADFNVSLKNCCKEPQLRNCFYKLTYRHVLWGIFLFLITVGGPSPLWMVPSLDKWAWVV